MQHTQIHNILYKKYLCFVNNCQNPNVYVIHI